MHDHHGTSADAGGRLNLLPLWLQVLWALVMCALIAHRVIACGFGSGHGRVWSGAHAMLAASMLYMFLPWPNAPLGSELVITACCAVLAVVLATLAAGWVATGSVERERLLIAIDSAAMAYMAGMTAGGVSAITYALVVFYTACAVARTRGTSLLDAARTGQIVMASAMAYMFLAMSWAS